MKEKPISLKIFNFGHPLQQTEWMSIRGDKYVQTLPFEWEFVGDLASAQVIAWDGVITPKNQELVEEVLKELEGPKVLLLIGESMTLLKDHPIVKMYEPQNIKCFEVSGWNILPEEILAALDECHRKLIHV